jgi:hypothetical protein
MNNYYTLVGSRETPKESLVTLELIAEMLAKAGWIGRSGGANGADTALEDGCKGVLSAKVEVYLPWNGFNGRYNSSKGCIDATKLKNHAQAMVIVEQTHPAWERCSRGVRALHTRNVYQVLGLDLVTPSKMLVCWAKPTSKTPYRVAGGTNTAVQLAMKHGAVVVNIYRMSQEEAIAKIKEVAGGVP